MGGILSEGDTSLLPCTSTGADLSLPCDRKLTMPGLLCSTTIGALVLTYTPYYNCCIMGPKTLF